MKKQIKKIIICLLLTICCLCGALIGTANNILYAVSNATEYTNVLYDLKTDSNFKVTDYSVNKNDYSLQVIQIAESVNNELFVYVYQPCSPNIDLQATSINISKSIDENLSYVNYKLKLVNFNGVFYKYKVDNFVLETTETRYYDISSIFRKWNANYDESPQNDNTISEVAFEVGKRFVVKTINDSITYDCLETETILITDKYVGTIQYLDGTDVIFKVNYSDSHFVAFDTDLPIDKLMEADVTYISQTYENVGATVFWHFLIIPIASMTGSEVTNYVSLNYTQKAETFSYGLFGHSYSWDRIQSVENFLSTENVSDDCKNAIKNMKWVLRFAETKCEETITPLQNVTGTKVTDVSILRLKFETNGIVYNLGVVDNKQSGSGIPVNNVNEMESFLKMILGIILLIVLLVILAPFLPAIFNFIILLFKGIWQVITAPFKALKKQKKKTKKGGGKK